MKHSPTLVFALTATLLVLGAMPDVAHACPSCFSGNDANRIAYIVTFVILTVLPLACVGGVAYWLYKRYAEAEAADAIADADEAAPTSVG